MQVRDNISDDKAFRNNYSLKRKKDTQATRSFVRCLRIYENTLLLDI